MPDGAGAGEAKVAHFSRQVVRAAVEAPVGDDAGAQACAHGKEHHVLATLAGAKAMLGHGPGVGVILDQTLNLEFALEDSLDGHIIPGGQIGRRLDDSLQAIQRAPATDSQPRDGGRVSAMLAQHFADARLDQFQRPLRPLGGAGGELLPRDDFGRSGGKQDSGFRSADIDSNQQLVLRRVHVGSPVLPWP